MTESQLKDEIDIALLKAIMQMPGKCDLAAARHLFASGVHFGSTIAVTECVGAVRDEVTKLLKPPDGMPVKDGLRRLP